MPRNKAGAMMKKQGIKIDNRKDLLLLLLYSPGSGNEPNEPISGRTRLLKLVFLFQKELMPRLKKDIAIPEGCWYEFFPWNFGPFSAAVYDDLNFFQLRGFIQTDSGQNEEDVAEEDVAEWEKWEESNNLDAPADETFGYLDQQFKLTDKGCDFAKLLFANLTANQAQLIKDFKRRLVKAPLRSILRYVYTTYPEQTSRSQIREKVLGSLDGTH
jgi:uncharacterized protein